MELIVNGQSWPLEMDGNETYTDLIRFLSEQLAPQGMTVTQVSLNHQNITGHSSDELEQLPLTEIEHLEVLADFPENVAVATLTTADEWVKRLSYEVEKAADLLRLGEDVEANTALTTFVDGFQLFQMALTRIEVLLGKRSSESEILTRLRTFQGRYSELLDEILEAQGTQDWILLADLLEYELLAIMADWRDLSGELAGTFKAQLADL